jgi:hypothetical protein
MKFLVTWKRYQEPHWRECNNLGEALEWGWYLRGWKEFSEVRVVKFAA